jgi:hypothetical protein
VPGYCMSIKFQISLITERFIAHTAVTHLSLCYRHLISAIVGSIHILVMCSINSRHMDAPHRGMSFQITVITERFFTLIAGTHLLHFSETQFILLWGASIFL